MTPVVNFVSLDSQNKVWGDWNGYTYTRGNTTTTGLTADYHWGYNIEVPETGRYVWNQWVYHTTTAGTTQILDDSRWYVNQNTTWNTWTTIHAYEQHHMPAWEVEELGVEAAVAAGRAAEQLQRMGQRTRDAADRLQAVREADSRRTLRLQREAAQRKELRDAAEARAQELLLMVITAEERLHLENNGHLLVVADSGNRYQIDRHRGVHGNIVQVDEHGCRLATLCVAPKMRDVIGNDVEILPETDGIVGQYLSLKHNEEMLIATANFSNRKPCQAPGVAEFRRAA